MSPRGLLWNAAEGRWRAGWRLTVQLLLFAAVLAACTGLAKALGSGIGGALLLWPVYMLAVIASIRLLARLVDHRPFADFGFHFDRAWWLDLGFGVTLGAFMLTGVFLTERAAGWITVSGPAVTSYAAPIGVAVLVKLVEWIAVGVSEEAVFRGYQLKNLAEGLAGPRRSPRSSLLFAVVVSSVLFALAHLANPNATVLSTLNIALSGFLLSLPVLLTGELAIPIGLHISWNLFEGTIYGFPVSGRVADTRLLTLKETGPRLWTGGGFGPEAGLVCLVWMVVAAGLVLAWVRFRQRGGAPSPAPPPR